jgi:hypothetical protein
MPHERTFGFDPKRHLAYSEWHRESSLRRFIPNAREMSMMDLDAVEIDRRTNTPLALIETTTGSADGKPHAWTAALGALSGVPSYVVACALSADVNPASSLGALDITGFDVRRLDDRRREQMTPQEYAEWLADLRRTPRALRTAA